MFAVDDFDVLDPFDIHEGREDSGWDILVDSDCHDVDALVIGSSDLHAVDVDAGSAENASYLTDHARLVFMRSDDDAAFWLEVDSEMIEGNNLGFFSVKEGAGDSVGSFVCVDGEEIVLVK